MKILGTRIVALLAVASVSALIGTANAVVIHPIGEASTALFAAGTGTGLHARGWDFQVNAPNLEVVELGVSAAVDIPITLSLWDVPTQTLLGQTIVNAAPDRAWTFGALGSPVALTDAGVYAVIGWADTTTVGTGWYVFSNSPPAAFNPTGDIQYLDNRFGNGIDENTFPTETNPFPLQYGVTDIGYRYRSIPEPATLALLGIGLAGLGFSRRKRASVFSSMKLYKATRLLVAAAGLLGLATTAQASITYNVNRTIGAGSVTGFFETNGTIGALSTADFLDWSLTVTAPNINGGVASTSSPGLGSSLNILGGVDNVSATASDILFNFSGGSIFWTDTSTLDWWCVAGSAGGCFSPNAEVIGYDDIGGAAAQTVLYTGVRSIASTVPEPATIALFGIGLAGLGFSRRRNRA